MKGILMRSDLSDQWDEYDWESMDAVYTEQYDG